MADQDIDANNQWRQESPGHDGWRRTARTDDPAKYFMISADGHVQEPADLWRKRMPKKYQDRLPGVANIEMWEDELSVTGPIDLTTRGRQAEKHRDHLHERSARD